MVVREKASNNAVAPTNESLHTKRAPSQFLRKPIKSSDYDRRGMNLREAASLTVEWIERVTYRLVIFYTHNYGSIYI